MTLEEMLGIDTSRATDRRARKLRDADRKLLRELVERRLELKLTQDEVARRMDTSQPTVARIESGTRDLHQSTLRRYAMAVEAVVAHVVVPDDRAYARSSAILRDLQDELRRTRSEGQWPDASHTAAVWSASAANWTSKKGVHA